MWIEKLARLGYSTKGLVYFVIGALALQLAAGEGGKTTGSKGAIRTIAEQPFGQAILAIVALGLLGYGLFCILQAIFNPDRKTGAEGVFTRISYVIKAFAYGSLSLLAANIAFGWGSGGGGRSKADWTAMLMRQPFGRWLVAGVGLIAIGLGIYYLYRAYKHQSRKKLNIARIHEENTEWAMQVGRVGVAARGVVFGIIGWFLLTAARQAQPQEVGGLDQVLNTVAAQPFGKILLGIVALGLIAYSFQMLVEARYRQMAAAREADSKAA